MSIDYWGHSQNGKGMGIPEFLRDHLTGTEARASNFAKKLGMASLAAAAARLHDLGKYADQMQRRLRGGSEPGRDHWSAGAMAALSLYSKREQAAAAIAAVILGHHTGLNVLQCFDKAKDAIDRAFKNDPERFTDVNVIELYQRFKSENSSPEKLDPDERLESNGSAATMLDVRMLFSCLVDADFLETEAHFNGDATVPRREREPSPSIDFARALELVESHVRRLQEGGARDAALQAARGRLFGSCLQAGKESVGLFTLEAPTGTGKTLTLLAFALSHAVTHGLDRVIVVLPFLNILDQTVRTYREVLCGAGGFDPRVILEDHSLADWSNVAGDDQDQSNTASADNPERLRRLLSENWDAPIVLTSNVKCLESLHGHRPSACRKLHRLGRSVIVFDEVQSIPADLVVPTLATLSHLSHRFGSTIVFATATQPAFSHLHPHVERLAPSGWTPRPLIDFANELFTATAGRTRVVWRIDRDRPTSWESLADELAQPVNRQVLCIVNLKRHATALLDRLKERGVEGLLHLSTQMCPRHRAEVLSQIQQRLRNGEPIRLIATQCIEAGVDVSFPRVYRALGPLEAIAQAAGRCNRHGEMLTPGEVTVFLPESDGKTLYPPGSYEHAAKTAETFLLSLRGEMQGNLDDCQIIASPERIARYYEWLYDLKMSSKKDTLTNKDVIQAMLALNFSDLAQHYRLIPNAQINVLVPYDEPEFNHLIEEIEPNSSGPKPPGFYRNWIQRARPLSVGVYLDGRASALRSYLIPIFFGRPDQRSDEEANWFYLRKTASHEPLLYDSDLMGLVLPEQDACCF